MFQGTESRRNMNRRLNNIVLLTALACMLGPLGFAQVKPGQKVETKGLILTRDGESMTVDSRDLGKVAVVINDSTDVQTPKGLFRSHDMDFTSLVPGLYISVKGTGDANGQVVADRIRFSKDDLRAAQQAHAAMTATKSQVAENKQNIEENQKGISKNAENISTNTADIQAAQKRFDDLTEFDVKKDVTVNFATGKADIPDDAKQQLTDLAKEASNTKGFLVEIAGYASTSGTAQLNQQLSQDRAANVTNFLHQQGIPLRRMVNPAAMGTAKPVAGNETEEDRLKNQRVEVKLLVSRGVASK
jgi:outer membrane protein OmpA-like peptidoglycan-associated protein